MHITIEDYKKKEGLPLLGTDNYTLLSQKEIDTFFSGSGVKSPAVGIQYMDLHGERMKCLNSDSPYLRMRVLRAEDEDKGKYKTTPGCSGFRVYIPLQLRKAIEGKKYLVITEGEKKADIACAHGIPCIGVGGVQMWFDPESEKEQREVHRDILEVIRTFSVSKVLVLYDSDGAEIQAKKLPETYVSACTPLKHKKGYVCKNIQVHKAALDFAFHLRRVEGLATTAQFCPPIIKKWKNDKDSDYVELDQNANLIVEKVGLDDWIQKKGADFVIQTIKNWLGGAKKGASLDANAYSKTSHIPLGVSQDGTHLVVWNTEVESLFEVNISKLTSGPALLQCMGSKSLESYYTPNLQTGKKVLDTMSAVQDLYEQCRSMGMWKMQSFLRGTGVWRHQDKLIINGVDTVLELSFHDGAVEEREIGRCELGRSLVLSKSSKGLQIVQERATEEDWKDFWGIIGAWNWKSLTDRVLCAGWLLQQSYTGALHYRPHVFLTGESGSGKTILLNFMSMFLSDTARSIDHGSDSSPAGLRQLLERDAATLILDEFEPASGEHNSFQRKKADSVAGVLQMLRASYSAIPDNEGDFFRSSVVKGSSSGKAQEFSLYSSAIMAGIAVSALEQADINRMLMIQISPIKNGTPPDISRAVEMGRRIRRTMWDHWPLFLDTLEYTHRYFMQRTGWDSRKCWTWATPVSCFLLQENIRKNAIWDDEAETNAQYLVNMLIQHAKPVAGIGFGSTESDQDRVLQLLLSYLIDVDIHEDTDSGVRISREKRPLEYIIDRALDYGLGSKSKRGQDSDEAQTLFKYGMTVKKEAIEEGKPEIKWLFLCFNNVSIQRISAKLSVSNIYALLSRIPLAHEGRANIHGVRKRGVWIPLPSEEEWDDSGMLNLGM